MMWSLLFLCLLYCIVSTNGIKETYSNVKSVIYGDFLVNDFGMAVGGRIDVDYVVGPKNASKPFKSYLLLLILSSHQKNSWYSGLGHSDTDVANNINVLCNQPAMLRQEIIGTGSIRLDIDYALGVDEYSVAVLQCRKGYNSNPVEIDITLIMRNARPDSDEYSHFPIQQVMEVRILQGEIIVYALLILGMMGQIYVARRYATHIHYVFLLTLVATFVFFFIKYGTFYEYNRSGVTNTPITIAQNVFGVISNGMLLLSLLLVSIGWTMIRSALMARELQVIQICISSYWIFGIAGAVCVDANNATCVALNLIPFVLQSLITLFIILLLYLSIAQLRAMVHNTPWVPSTPLQYARYQQYRALGLMFPLYLLLPTAFSMFRSAQFGWKEDWMSFVLSDFLDLALFFHVGVTFSPLHDALLTRAFDGSAIGAEPHFRDE